MNEIWKYTIFFILLQSGPDDLFSLLKGGKGRRITSEKANYLFIFSWRWFGADTEYGTNSKIVSRGNPVAEGTSKVLLKVLLFRLLNLTEI